MSKSIEPHRLQLHSYPYQISMDTQFGDMDVHGHVNNLAIARYFESARARLQLELYTGYRLFQSGADFAMLLVENNVRFLAECEFPGPVIAGTAIGHIGKSSYQFLHGLFQHERCVALCEAIMVCAKCSKSIPVPEEVRGRMESMRIRSTYQGNRRCVN